MELKQNRRTFLLLAALTGVGVAVAGRSGRSVASVSSASSPEIPPLCFFGGAHAEPSARPRTQSISYLSHE